jgi:hypothetical protein
MADLISTLDENMMGTDVGIFRDNATPDVLMNDKPHDSSLLVTETIDDGNKLNPSPLDRDHAQSQKCTSSSDNFTLLKLQEDNVILNSYDNSVAKQYLLEPTGEQQSIIRYQPGDDNSSEYIKNDDVCDEWKNLTDQKHVHEQNIDDANQTVPANHNPRNQSLTFTSTTTQPATAATQIDDAGCHPTVTVTTESVMQPTGTAVAATAISTASDSSGFDATMLPAKPIVAPDKAGMATKTGSTAVAEFTSSYHCYDTDSVGTTHGDQVVSPIVQTQRHGITGESALKLSSSFHRQKFHIREYVPWVCSEPACWNNPKPIIRLRRRECLKAIIHPQTDLVNDQIEWSHEIQNSVRSSISRRRTHYQLVHSNIPKSQWPIAIQHGSNTLSAAATTTSDLTPLEVTPNDRLLCTVINPPNVRATSDIAPLTEIEYSAEHSKPADSSSPPTSVLDRTLPLKWICQEDGCNGHTMIIPSDIKVPFSATMVPKTGLVDKQKVLLINDQVPWTNTMKNGMGELIKYRRRHYLNFHPNIAADRWPSMVQYRDRISFENACKHRAKHSSNWILWTCAEKKKNNCACDGNELLVCVSGCSVPTKLENGIRVIDDQVPWLGYIKRVLSMSLAERRLHYCTSHPNLLPDDWPMGMHYIANTNLTASAKTQTFTLPDIVPSSAQPFASIEVPVTKQNRRCETHRDEIGLPPSKRTCVSESSAYYECSCSEKGCTFTIRIRRTENMAPPPLDKKGDIDIHRFWKVPSSSHLSLSSTVLNQIGQLRRHYREAHVHQPLPLMLHESNDGAVKSPTRNLKQEWRSSNPMPSPQRSNANVGTTDLLQSTKNSLSADESICEKYQWKCSIRNCSTIVSFARAGLPPFELKKNGFIDDKKIISVPPDCTNRSAILAYIRSRRRVIRQHYIAAHDELGFPMMVRYSRPGLAVSPVTAEQVQVKQPTAKPIREEQVEEKQHAATLRRRTTIASVPPAVVATVDDATASLGEIIELLIFSSDGLESHQIEKYLVRLVEETEDDSEIARENVSTILADFGCRPMIRFLLNRYRRSYKVATLGVKLLGNIVYDGNSYSSSLMFKSVATLVNQAISFVFNVASFHKIRFDVHHAVLNFLQNATDKESPFGDETRRLVIRQTEPTNLVTLLEYAIQSSQKVDHDGGNEESHEEETMQLVSSLLANLVDCNEADKVEICAAVRDHGFFGMVAQAYAKFHSNEVICKATKLFFSKV